MKGAVGMAVQSITSRANPYIKELSKLEDKKYREKSNKFCFEGRKLLEEAILNYLPIEAVLCTERAYNDEKCAKLLSTVENTASLYLISNEVYDKLSFEKSPEGIFTVSGYLTKLHSECDVLNTSDERTVILDGIRDPGNLGTILRTASAFGYESVILSSDCADIYNPKTVRASMGAVFHIKTYRVSSLPGTVKVLRALRPVYAAALSNTAVSLTAITDVKLPIFIIGNEGSGIRPDVMDAATGAVIIPMTPGTESLNAASAATILMWEQFR